MINRPRFVTRHAPRWKIRIFILICIFGLSLFFILFGVLTKYKLVRFSNEIKDNSTQLYSVFNYSSNSTTPTLCMVTRTYWEQIDYFLVFALGLYYTGLGNIRIYVTNTDRRSDIRQLQQNISFINQLVRRTNYVSFIDLGAPPVGKDFGYEMTDRALSHLYKQRERSPFACQYVTFTNGDNFYSRNFAKKILPYMNAGKDMIGWGFVSHHCKPHYRESIDNKTKRIPQIVDDGTEKCTPVELKAGFADLGSVAYRLSFLKKHNLYFRGPDGAYSFGSDGYFVEQAARLTDASIILKQTLLIHQ